MRPREEGGYWLVAGERRLRATKNARIARVPAVARDLNDRESLAIALVENLQREDLNAIDEARSVARLIGEFNLTHQDAADALGRSRAAVSNALRLLDLNDAVRTMVVERRLEMGHARALLALKPEEQGGMRSRFWTAASQCASPSSSFAGRRNQGQSGGPDLQRRICESRNDGAIESSLFKPGRAPTFDSPPLPRMSSRRCLTGCGNVTRCGSRGALHGLPSHPPRTT